MFLSNALTTHIYFYPKNKIVLSIPTTYFPIFLCRTNLLREFEASVGGDRVDELLLESYGVTVLGQLEQVHARGSRRKTVITA